MATRFDTVVHDLVAAVERHPAFSSVQKLCVVRDLKGLVRLVTEGLSVSDRSELTASLGTTLQPWFCGPILDTTSTSLQEQRIANDLLSRSSDWPPNWPDKWSDIITGVQTTISDKWRAYQRVLSKQAWLETSSNKELWDLSEGNPAIVAFYSFKGGVGRSTLLGVVAWQLAKEGKNVVCLDLDLEAPGLSGLFERDTTGSVLDCILSHAATERLPADNPIERVTLVGQDIGLLSAGRVNRAFLEKLARLDYLGTTAANQSPVARALNSLLHRVRGQVKPDYIFLDCRAGLHDIGGLSLSDVAHIDVFVGRDTPQGREGLALALEVAARRRATKAQRFIIAQTFVPLPLDGTDAKTTRERFRKFMYEACQNALPSYKDDLPEEEDNQAAHYPWPVGQYDEIAKCEKLAEISGAVLDNDAYQQIRRRIEALSSPEGASE